MSVIGSSVVIKLADFKPYKSIEQLLDQISNKLTIGGLTYNFKSIEEGFRISAESESIDAAIKSIDLFVELFSN